MNAEMIEPIEIQTQFIPSIIWQKNDSIADTDLDNTVHIWKIKVPEHFCSLFKEYRHILNSKEYEKAKNFHWEDDFRSYLTGRMVLRILLSKYLDISALDIEFGASGTKPTIHKNDNLKFNLSYSGEYILISLSKTETGVDIEKINPKFDYQSLLESCFAGDENQFILADSKNSRRNFFLQWTRKEALLKYTGQGIIDNLIIVPSMDGTRSITESGLDLHEDLQVVSFDISQDCVGTIAYPRHLKTIKYYTW